MATKEVARIAAATFYCLAPEVFGGEKPTTQYERAPLFETLDAAAAAALTTALQLAQKVEYGGVLIRCGEGFTYTSAVTSNKRGVLEYRITIPEVCHLAGLYHTHPAMPMAHTFSAADVAAASTLDVPSYIGLASDGSIRIFDPAKARRVTGSVSRDAAAEGELLVQAAS